MSELTYPYAEHPKAGTTQELYPGVRWLTMPMGGGSLNHINLYLLEDDAGWWVVDTGLNLAEVAGLWDDIFTKELGGKPVVAVLCTHFHPDHIGQARMISDRFQVPLYMTHGEYYQARAFFGNGPGSDSNAWQSDLYYRRSGMPVEQLNALRESWKQRRGDGMTMPLMPEGYVRLRHGDTLKIGKLRWRIVVGSGHSPEHACLLCNEASLLLSGDQILPVITSNVSVHASEPEANPMKDWMDSIDRLLELPDDLFVLPAHNLPFYGVRTRLRDLIEHHEERLHLIEEQCRTPTSAYDLLPVLFQRKLDPRQSMMAMGEAIAHAHLLLHRNQLERSLNEDGCYRFRTIARDRGRNEADFAAEALHE